MRELLKTKLRVGAPVVLLNAVNVDSVVEANNLKRKKGQLPIPVGVVLPRSVTGRCAVRHPRSRRKQKEQKEQEKGREEGWLISRLDTSGRWSRV